MPVSVFAFVSVFAWPPNWDRAQMVDAMARCVGLDPPDADLRVAKPPPLAITRMEQRPAGAAVAALRDLGIRAFAPTKRQIDGLDRPILAKRMSQAQGATSPMYLIEPWRGESAGLLMSDVFLILRAQVASTRSTAADPITQVGFDTATGVMSLDRVLGRTPRTSLAQVIELHCLDGRRIRIDANKFNFDCLGDDRAMADAVNADLLAEQLISQAPRAAVETGFRDFSPPPGASRPLDPGSPLFRSRMPEFEFYSAWLHILHRIALDA